jgi:CRISPR system Cascade subunit CasB
MTTTKQNWGETVYEWWRQNLAPQQDNGSVRGFRARLRRAENAVDAAAEPLFIDLYDLLERRPDPIALAHLTCVLALVKQHEDTRIAQKFGGDPAPLSSLRFQRLIRSREQADLAVALRRALPLIGHSANVRALSSDFLGWDDRARTRWCFDYFGKHIPDSLRPDSLRHDSLRPESTQIEPASEEIP